MEQPSTIVIVTAVLQSTITGIGLIGNLLVIFVLIMARDRQDTSSVTYVLNLAFADFFFLMTFPFTISEDIHFKWIFGEFMCKFTVGLVQYLNFFVSPLFLMVMSIDRYLAINKAVSSAKLRALKSSRFVSVAVWVIGLIAVFVPAMFHTAEDGRCRPVFPGPVEDGCDMPRLEICVDEVLSLTSQDNISSKTKMVTALPETNTTKIFDTVTVSHLVTRYRSRDFTMEHQNTTILGKPLGEANDTSTFTTDSRQTLQDCYKKYCSEQSQKFCKSPQQTSLAVWRVLNFLYSYLIPCAVIVICYAAILCNLYRPSRIVTARRHAMKKRVTLMVALLVISYLVCFTPYYVWQLVLLVGAPVSDIKVCPEVARFNTTMACLNSALNPILYTFLGDKFGDKFKLAFRRARRGTRNGIGARVSMRIASARQRRYGGGTMRQYRPEEQGRVENGAEERNLVEIQNHNHADEIHEERHGKQPESQEGGINGGSGNGTTNEPLKRQRSQTSQNGHSRMEIVSRCLPCVDNCTTTRGCPECAYENNRVLFKNGNYDITEFGDVNKENKETDLENGQMLKTESRENENSGKPSGKLCKKHLKTSIARATPDGYITENIDPGRWKSMTSLRSISKFPTDVTTLPTNV